MSPEDFIKGDGYSILRNPLIAETMYMSADIEKWASGLKRIYDECTAAGVKVEFKRVKIGFVVSFQRPKWEEGKRLAEKLVERLAESQHKILVLVRGNPSISKKELSDKVGISTTAIDKNIAQLKKKGLLKRVGPDKGGHWEISG